MDPNALMGMIFTLVLTMLIGGFILLYPLTRRLGQLLESRVSQGEASESLQGDVRRLAQTVESLELELRSLRERQEFTEKVLATRDRGRLPSEP